MSLFAADTPSYDFIVSQTSDPRPFPSYGEVEHLGRVLITEIIDTFGKDALEEHASMIAHCIIGGIHAAQQRIEREYDRATLELNGLHREFDGSEVKDTQIQDATEKSRYFEAVAVVLETFRKQAELTYEVQTGDVWTPYRGSASNRLTTYAVMEAGETLRRKRQHAQKGAEPTARYVVFRGVQSANTQADAERIFAALNYARSQCPDMQLACTGNLGSEKIAMMWARSNNVIVHKADFSKAAGRRAPFVANDTLLALKPVMVFYMPTPVNPTNAQDAEPSGIVLNISQKASERGIPVFKVAANAAKVAA
ncbi:DUF2493 domain-containing protein [Asticcacaulis excentricus]|uniref:YspA cpYpsA-related SLOG domain-containing protein n=1 Tax=Asticcacaulis excentricus (strain ATCC 15261 / DSM 4724 / KCTC 12464 / NCIMB 9791 / VKM B-1370 / CB 48) TaxID=573065 RepID=E8RVV7_ASTEC|nr:DUF2493 domain-containing protein [Asticcacaulis excentricus]ADU15379.1 Protein of unknown function DUF2493 [Asticcacaulis excentricus CB 48]